MPVIFLDGIYRMGREEKITFLAQMHSFSTGFVIRQALGSGLLKVKGEAFRLAGIAMGRLEKRALQDRIWYMDQQITWQVETIKKEMQKYTNMLAAYSDRDIERMLREKILEISGSTEDVPETALAGALLYKLARPYSIDPSHFTSMEELEEEVFNAVIREEINKLRKRINCLSPREIVEFESYLAEDLAAMNDNEKKAISRALGLQDISAKDMLEFLKKAPATTLVQLIGGAYGMGAYLFLATCLHSFGLVSGISVPVGAYTMATAAASILLSGPLVILFLAGGGGYVYKATGKRIHDQLARLLLLSGHARHLLMEDEEECIE